MPNERAEYRRLETSFRAPVRAKRIGVEDPEAEIFVSVRVRRRADAPRLPSFDEYGAVSGFTKLDRARFVTTYGADPADMERVSEFATEHEIEVLNTSAIRRTVFLRGSAEKLSKAFEVNLFICEFPEGRFRVREGYISVPASLSNVIEGVFGLDNRRVVKRLSRRKTSRKAGAITAITPAEVARLYNFPSPPSNFSETIALLEFGGGYYIDSKTGAPKDIVEYFSESGTTAPRFAATFYDGAINDAGDGESKEVALDIEVAGAAAPGVSIMAYFAPIGECGFVDALTGAMAGDEVPEGWKLPSVISISWGWGELAPDDPPGWTVAGIETISACFQEAAALGITVLVASGDSGSNAGGPNATVASVAYPASDPWVTACGGTEISNVNGAVFTEATWVDQDDDFATGGGISDIFPLPLWQAGAGVPPSVNDGHIGRGIPDIAGYAAGYTIVFKGKHVTEVPGTSEVAPLYAGLIAIINSLAERPVGFLNPILYSYGGSRLFRDIADGQSNVTPTTPGYTSLPGWDACTGLGSVDGEVLLQIVRLRSIFSIAPLLDFTERKV